MAQETYKGYKIEEEDYGFFGATNTTDCDEPMIHCKTIESLKQEIDELEWKDAQNRLALVNYLKKNPLKTMNYGNR